MFDDIEGGIDVGRKLIAKLLPELGFSGPHTVLAIQKTSAPARSQEQADKIEPTPDGYPITQTDNHTVWLVKDPDTGEPAVTDDGDTFASIYAESNQSVAFLLEGLRLVDQYLDDYAGNIVLRIL